ncbi:MAG: hypothetical protein HJJLKODD_01427 [Phycisphaerae bacterium]|nr:hypothetical protein [Phycisphaerae bacterium]
MGPDDEICYCYHVSLRKLVNYTRRVQPHLPSQLHQCLGAGTGCGWCIPILLKIHQQCRDHDGPWEELVKMTPEEYAAARDLYRKSGAPKNNFGPAAGNAED